MTEMMKRYEQEKKKDANDELYSGSMSLYFPTVDYIDWLEAKAAAYDRLMSGGKKTPKEWANFIGKPIAMNENGEWYWYSVNVHQGCNIWYPNNSRSPSGMLPFYLIDFSGDWTTSLTLPDGWETKGENK